MKMTRILMAFALIGLLMSCGGDTKEEKKEKVKIGTTNTSDTTTTSASIEIELLGNDQMQFDKKVMRVKEGQEVTIVLKHTGKMAANIMGHNFVLLKPGIDIGDFGSKASAAKASDYIPDGGKDVIAHTKMIGGGETASVTFKAPAKGEYDFICSFPGHYGIMKGKFIVE